MEYTKVPKPEIAVVDGKVGSLLPFLSFCSLIFRTYSSLIAAQPSRSSCTTPKTSPPQKHTPFLAETLYPGKLHQPSETNTHCSCGLLPFPAAHVGGCVQDCFDCNEQGEYAADAGADGETEERCG
jgi:hypothetical protein